MRPLTRRTFCAGMGFGLFSTAALAGSRKAPLSLYEMDLGPTVPTPSPSRPARATSKSRQLPPAESEIDFPIKASAARLPKRFQPQTVDSLGIAAAGSIVIAPGQHFLYHVNKDGTARRYGVGVGREGFGWSGRAEIGMKRRWPRWVPPRSMVLRDKNARRWANGQPGGPDNPLGARALYLYKNGRDTLYRIHGTNQPSSIGKSVSSGCIRMLNEHVAELYDRVSVGTPVIVLSSDETPQIIQANR